VNLSLPSNINLNAIGGYIYIASSGVRGIIVYRKSATEFVALDRNCTYDPKAACATVVVDNTNFFAEDTCCHSKFQINNGQVVNGPAALPLKEYPTEFDGNIVHIYN
jgi:nitrite reductase/ring-hydroxylating ferredoxin subunit